MVGWTADPGVARFSERLELADATLAGCQVVSHRTAAG
jgi:hypothetical protein